MKVLGIIPARYGSARFEGKPLADIYGKPMIQRVYEQAIKAIDVVYVATDHLQIYDAVKSFGGNVVMTNADHETGTNRCLEASNKIQESFSHNVVVNIQGDEPLLDPENLIALLQIFVSDNSVEFGTLIKSIDSNTGKLEAGDGVYVTKTENNEAMLFSRSIIPFVRDYSKENWTKQHAFFKHIGVYAYTVSALQKFAKLPKSKLEIAENLEQLRWLENGGKIKLALVEDKGIAVDTPEDLERVLKRLKE